jgi:hypothetical protein
MSQASLRDGDARNDEHFGTNDRYIFEMTTDSISSGGRLDSRFPLRENLPTLARYRQSSFGYEAHDWCNPKPRTFPILKLARNNFSQHHARQHSSPPHRPHANSPPATYTAYSPSQSHRFPPRRTATDPCIPTATTTPPQQPPEPPTPPSSCHLLSRQRLLLLSCKEQGRSNAPAIHSRRQGASRQRRVARKTSRDRTVNQDARHS